MRGGCPGATRCGLNVYGLTNTGSQVSHVDGQVPLAPLPLPGKTDVAVLGDGDAHGRAVEECVRSSGVTSTMTRPLDPVTTVSLHRADPVFSCLVGPTPRPGARH